MLMLKRNINLNGAFYLTLDIQNITITVCN